MTDSKPGLIVTTILHPFVARAMLYSNILTRLAETGHEIKILVPHDKVDFYTTSYSHPHLHFVGVDLSTLNTKIVHRMKVLLEYAINTNIKRYHAGEIYAQNKNLFAYCARLFLTHTVGRSSLLQHLFRTLFVYETRNLKTGLETHLDNDVDLVISNDVYNEYDVLMLMEANRRKVRTIGIIRSWDNNISKTLLPIVPDTLVCQSETLRNEIEKNHHVRTNIKISGVPYYEYYQKYKGVSREDFFDKIGIPHNSLLILFSPAGKKFIDNDWEFCQILKEAILQGTLPKETRVLIRCHPSNTTDLSRFATNEHFIIETPGISFGQIRQKDNELDLHSINHLIDSLRHSSVIINLVSSIIIDGAVVGTPTIMPSFEGRTPATFLRSVARYQKEDCMRKLLTVWGGSRPKNESELISEVNRIFHSDQSTDTGAVHRLLSAYCPFIQESPSTRLFDIIRDESLNREHV